MAVPITQMWTVASYVLTQRLIKKNKRYPLVLMLEPLYRCNLACAGCGKIQYPSQVLKSQLSVEECMKAVDECPAPMVSIPGGEPLMHPDIEKIVEGIIARKKYVYLCTNAILLEEKLHLFKPSKYLTFSVHMDGLEKEHDFAVCRDGVYKVAARAIQKAVSEGFRVTTNTTLFDHSDPDRTHQFFDEMMKLGVEGMMISPGYSYSKAPDQQNFLKRRKTHNIFRTLLHGAKRSWKFNQSPLFLEFLAGVHEFECTPWGNPTYSVFGWQKPCYLLQEGYADSFKKLIDETKWQDYGRKSGNPKCQDCMVHCGHEPTAVNTTFGSWKGFARTVKAVLLGPAIPKPDTNGLHAETSGEEETSTFARGYSANLLEKAPAERNEILRAAFDYRGNVTLKLRDGVEREGYVFKYESGNLDIWHKNTNEKESIGVDSIQTLTFSGVDTAEGRSWEAWVKKHQTQQSGSESHSEQPSL